MNEPRNWKWMVSAGAVPVLFMIALVISEISNKNLPVLLTFGCQCMMLTLMCIAGISAVANFRNYFMWEEEERFRMHQDALSTTPLTVVSGNLRQLHPEAVRLLNKFGVKTAWEVKVGSSAEDREWYLRGTNVNMRFVEYFLEHSTTSTVMPKRMLSEGAFHWDPADKLTTDYQQYDEFLKWLFSRMMITMPFGNQAGQWIPPWGPALVAEIMGLVEEEQGEVQLTTKGTKVHKGIPNLAEEN